MDEKDDVEVIDSEIHSVICSNDEINDVQASSE